MGKLGPQSPVYGLVRDKHGKPKFADINHIPKVLWDMLTPEEQRDIQEERRDGTDDSRRRDAQRTG